MYKRQEIALTLLAPLAIGMLVLRYFSKIAADVSRWSIRMSLVLILAIVIGSASAGRLDMDAFGLTNLLLVLTFIAGLAVTSWVTTKLLGFKQADCTAIEMEVVVRNVNLAVLIKASMFPATLSDSTNIGDMVLFTALIYGALQMLIAAVLIFIRRRSAA